MHIHPNHMQYMWVLTLSLLMFSADPNVEVVSRNDKVD